MSALHLYSRLQNLLVLRMMGMRKNGTGMRLVLFGEISATSQGFFKSQSPEVVALLVCTYLYFYVDDLSLTLHPLPLTQSPPSFLSSPTLTHSHTHTHRGHWIQHTVETENAHSSEVRGWIVTLKTNILPLLSKS